jgi:multidrug efflux system membrane fusion protein
VVTGSVQGPGGQPAPPAGAPRAAIMAPPPRRPRLPMLVLWAVVFVLVVLGIVWFAHSRTGAGGAAGAHGGRGGRGANLATTVSVATVGRGDLPIYLNELGSVTPLATVTVTSQVSGYLQSIGFKEGQLVHKGQFLAQIDPRQYQAQLLQAQGNYARDQASLAQAELDLKRYRLLLSQDSIASQTVDQQAALVKQDEGTLIADRAAIATARLDLTYAHVTSPITGRAGLRLVDVGNYVSTVSNVTAANANTATGIVVVTQLTPIDVQFTLPEDNLTQVQARMRSGASLPVTAYDRTGAIELAHGQLFALDSQVDPTTGTIKAKARFDNGAGDLFPQQFVNVRITVDTLSNAVLAPNTAVLRGSNGLYVYVVQGGQNNHTVTVKTVKTGPTDGTNTVILSGVDPGAVVVTDGTDRLREGAPVILPGDCIPAMGPGGAGGHHRHGGGPPGAGAKGAGSGGCPKGEQPAGQPSAAAMQGGGGAVGGPGSSSSTSSSSGAQSAAPAQPLGQGQGQGGRMQAMLSQLNLDGQQQLKAQAIFTQARGDAMSQAAGAGDDPDARRQAMHAAYDKAFDQLDAILRPDQKAKLAQLRAQMHGGGGQGGGGSQGGGDQ